MINTMVYAILGISLFTNLALIFTVFNLRAKRRQAKPDASAQEVLSELMAGPAVFKIEVIDRNSLIQWRPHA